MKRILYGMMIFILSFGMMACGGKEESKDAPKEAEATQTATNEVVPEEGAVLKIWESKGTVGEYIKFAAKKYEEKYGVHVVLEENNISTIKNKVIQDGPAGTAADVFVAPHDQIGDLVQSGLIMENLVSADRVKNDFLPAAGIGVTNKGKVYGFPLAIETYALYYNKDLLTEAPKTFEDLIKFGENFTDKSKNKFGIFWDIPNFYYAHMFMAMDGGYVFGKDGTDANDIGLDNEGSIKGINKMLLLKSISVQNAGDVSYDAMTGLFAEGKVAAIINGPWGLEGAEKSGVNFDVAPIPTFDGKHPASFSGIRTLLVNSYTKYPKAAQLFAEFATSDEMLIERFKMTNQLPPVKALIDAPEIVNHKYTKAFLEQAQYAVPMPAIPEMGLIWEPAGAAVTDIWNGKVTAEEGLKNMTKIIKEQMETRK